MKVRTWVTEFGGDCGIPECVLSAVAAGKLRDASWHNDAAPCFEGAGFFLWADHIDPQRRECPGARFVVVAGEPSDHGQQMCDEKIFDTDSETELAAWLAAHGA